MKKLLASIALAGVLAISAFGQATILTPTTLSAAITKVKQKTIVVASATGITAPSTPGVVATDLYIDKELMTVEAVSGTTITVSRGMGSTTSTEHASGALVWFATPSNFFVGSANNAGVGGGYPVQAGGSCTRANLLVTPSINVETGVISDCLGGVWVNGVNDPLPQSHVPSPVVGGIAVTSLTAGVAMPVTDMGCTEIFLPYNKNLTGLGLLNGATASTDDHIVALYDAKGNFLTSNATAGTLAAGASDYQYIPFTAKWFAVGPAVYYGCYQTNGVTGLVHMVDSATGASGVWAGYIGTQTFGTIPPTITVPTTFTSAQGPFYSFY